MKPTSVICLLFVVLCLTASAESDRVKEWLRADRNKDGALSREETSGIMRRFFSRNDRNKDGRLSTAELVALDRELEERRKAKTKSDTSNLGVEVRKNLAYREGHDRWKLDVYLPSSPSPKGGRPGLVFVHGGGWKSGSKDRGQWVSLPSSYAAKGYVCISVNYRLTGDGGGFPQCVHDVQNAVRWFRANASDFGLDPNRIGAYGNSAGAHLVSMLGLAGAEANLEGDGPHLDQSSLVAAVCASATPSNFLSWKGEPFPNRGLLEGPEESIEKRRSDASPISHVSREAPPFLLIHAQDDTVVPFPQGKILEEKLKAAGAKDVTLMSFKNGGHGVFSSKKDQTHPAMEAFFTKALKLEN